MRTRINGRIYDTETAKKAVRSVTVNSAKETLYRKRNGEYFLFLENNETIKPLSKNELNEWCVRNLNCAELHHLGMI